MFTFILQLILAIPTLIKITFEIIALIKKLPKAEQAPAAAKLQAIVKPEIPMSRAAQSCALAAFHAELCAKK